MTPAKPSAPRIIPIALPGTAFNNSLCSESPGALPPPGRDGTLPNALWPARVSTRRLYRSASRLLTNIEALFLCHSSNVSNCRILLPPDKCRFDCIRLNCSKNRSASALDTGLLNSLDRIFDARSSSLATSVAVFLMPAPALLADEPVLSSSRFNPVTAVFVSDMLSGDRSPDFSFLPTLAAEPATLSSDSAASVAALSILFKPSSTPLTLASISMLTLLI